MDCSLSSIEPMPPSPAIPAAGVAIPAKLPHRCVHLVSLHDALDMLMKTASGFTMNAEFHVSAEGGMNSAGFYISSISDDLCSRYLDVIEALRETTGHDYATERRRKMILAAHDIDQDDDALDLVLKFTERN